MDGFFLVSRRINFLVVRHSDGLVRWRTVPEAGKRIPLDEVFSADPRNKLARRVELGKSSLADQAKTSRSPQRGMNTDKEEIGGCRSQIPSFRSQIKDQIPSSKMENADKTTRSFSIWRLSFPWDLGIGIWNFRKATTKELVDKMPPSFPVWTYATCFPIHFIGCWRFPFISHRL